MRKLVLGMSALALVASAAAFAQEEDNTRVAAAETPSFTKLDADADGRVSAIEAANNSRVAAAFTAADANRDGYLSKAEYAQVEKSISSAAPRPNAPSAEDSQVPAPR